MYVRQEAYYNAVPDGKKISRAEQIERINQGIKDRQNKSDDDSESEEEDLDDSTDVSAIELQEIPMPELTPGSEYLVALLHSAGTASATGMGLTGLSWQELEAWVRCSDLERIVTPRDLKTIHTLSRVYANESAKASQKGATPPYTPEVVDIEVIRDIVEAKVDDIFSMFMANNKGQNN